MIRRALGAWAGLGLWACTGDPGGGAAAPGGSDPDTPVDSGPTDDTAAPGTCERFGFPDAVTWALPPVPGPGPWRATSSLLCAADEQVLHLVEDIDGDDVEDFIMVRDCAGLDGTGDDHWVVFRGTGSGWSETPETWRLPPPMRPYGWTNIRSSGCEGPARSRYAVQDLTGDAVPDLVVFDDCDADTDVGRGTWRVHAGGSGGFDVDGVPWVVAEDATASAFTQPERRDCGEDQTPRYTLVDVDGDDVRDLLLTGDCGAHPGLGTLHWRMIPGTGAGFDFAAAQVLGLPALGDGVELPISGSVGCQSSTDVVFGFGDADDDEDRDLIVSGFCDGRAEPGTTRWDVYAYEDGALSAAPLALEMPDIGVERAWVRSGDPRCSAASPVAQAFWDVDDDDLWDVLVREMCVEGAPAGLGTDHYRLWMRNADLSLSEETRFELPADPEGTLYLDLQDDFCGHAGDAIVQFGGLNADAVPDLITTHGCTADSPTGWTEWQVALGGCLDPSR